MFHRLRRQAPVLLGLLLYLVPGASAAECKLARIAELPVTMNGLQPTVTAQINGTDAVFTLDSGAFWSVLSPASAAQYKLHLDHNRLPGFYMRGIGGNVDVAVTTVKTFTIFNVPLHNFDFIVGGSEVGEDSVGVVGQNILRIADVEYDLGQGTMRLFRATSCRKANLAYWVKPGSGYSEMQIEQPTPLEPHTVGTGYLNGAKLRITFDSGAQISVVGLRAAASAGIKPDSPGVQPAGAMSGFGRSAIRTWIATFPVLKIGDEEVHNARLHFGDLGSPDMLLGSDFFLSHRIYVANSQGKLYFTYNGGPVFNLNPPHDAQAAANKPATSGDGATPESPLSAATASADAKEPAKDSTTPEDAAAIARHAAALAARHDFDEALQEFNRACELAPAEPAYYYQRARVRLNLRQADSAASDLDEALKLKPDYLDAVVARAELNLFKKNRAAVLTDLEAADRLAAKESDIRLTLASLYERADSPEQALTQLDLWIPIHSQDVRLPQAYNERCWNRALAGRQLDLALEDCNAGLRIAHSPQLLDSRGLVYLRSGKLDKAIADYNAALKINPRIAWSLYGRGVAEMRKGMTSQGEADMAAAAAIAPRLSETAKKIGVVP